MLNDPLQADMKGEERASGVKTLQTSLPDAANIENDSIFAIHFSFDR